MSATPEAPLLPSPSEPPEASASVAALEPAELEYVAARTAFLTPERSQQSSLLLLGTMVLFALAAKQGDQGWKDVVLLVGVLLFHELGHWLGMRLFGFQDVQMFFIPFLGAAVSGRNVGAVAWKEALVLLMGPMPGLVLGTALLVWSALEPSLLVAGAGQLLLIINAFNLLPIAPLDGGKLFQLLLFSRHRYLEVAFTVFAGLALLGLAFLLGAWVLGIVAGLMLIGLPRQARLLGIADALRSSTPGVEREPAALDEPAMRSLYSASAALIPEGTAAEVRLTPHVRAMREVHQRARMHPPSVLASLGLSTLWGLGVVVTFVGIVMIGSGSTPRTARWAQYTAEQAGFSVLMPVEEPLRTAVFYGEAAGQQVDGDTHLAQLWADHDYSVTSWKLEALLATEEEREQWLEKLRSTLVAQAQLNEPPVQDAPKALEAITGHHLAFSEAAGRGQAVVREEYWFGAHQGRGFILRARYDSRLATAEEVERFFTSFRPLP